MGSRLIRLKFNFNFLALSAFSFLVLFILVSYMVKKIIFLMFILSILVKDSSKKFLYINKIINKIKKNWYFLGISFKVIIFCRDQLLFLE